MPMIDKLLEEMYFDLEKCIDDLNQLGRDLLCVDDNKRVIKIQRIVGILNYISDTINCTLGFLRHEAKRRGIKNDIAN